jgi:signal peptidase I
MHARPYGAQDWGQAGAAGYGDSPDAGHYGNNGHYNGNSSGHGSPDRSRDYTPSPPGWGTNGQIADNGLVAAHGLEPGGSPVLEGRGSVTWFQTPGGMGTEPPQLPGSTVPEPLAGGLNESAGPAAGYANGAVNGQGPVNGHAGDPSGGSVNGYGGTPANGSASGLANGTAKGSVSGYLNGSASGYLTGTVNGYVSGTLTGTVTGTLRGSIDGSPAPETWLGTSVPPRRRDLRATAYVPSAPATRAPASRRLLRTRSKPRTALGSAGSAAAEVVIVLSMALILSLVIKTFLVQAFFIPSQSMENTLLIGDRVLVSKLTPGPLSLHRGDVIVFKDPGGWLPAQIPQPMSAARGAMTSVLTFVGLLPQDSGEHLIKRVIGLPGDTVICCDKTGRLQVNGISITEPYLKPGVAPSEVKFTVTVRAGQLWVMGDNRAESADSRLHREINDGQVPLGDVVGKAFVVVWPFGRIGGVADPPGVFTGVPAKAPMP